jgi:hypothetical protein
MNTYKFSKFPNSKTWRLSKHIFETEQTLPTEAGSVRGTFDGAPAALIRITERISGDTEFNERRRIVGFQVQTEGYLQTFKPDNVHLLFDYEGFHEGCTDKCHCQVYKTDQAYFEHMKVCKCS